MNTLSEQELEEIIAGVWMTVLDLPVVPVDAPNLAADKYLTAGIRITGSWIGTIKLRATPAFLALAAEHVFMMKVEDIGTQEHVDMLTELTNMVGGIVKSLLPEICDLSLPELLVEQSAESAVTEASASWTYFSSNGHPLGVEISEDSAVLNEVA